MKQTAIALALVSASTMGLADSTEGWLGIGKRMQKRMQARSRVTRVAGNAENIACTRTRPCQNAATLSSP